MPPNPKKPEKADLENQKIVLSNAVVRAGHSLSLAEKRLVMLAVSKLDSRRRPKGPPFHPVSYVTAREYAEAFGLEMNTAYEALENAGKRLWNRYLTCRDEKRGTVDWIRWIGRARYHGNEGWIELHWWHELLPHLFQLKKQFTTYQLAQAAALRSVYSWRLLELIKQMADEDEEGELKIGHEAFCDALQVPPSIVKHFGLLRKKVIDPAVKELVDKDGWVIEWEPTRTGRKVTGLRFSFERSPQQRFELTSD